MKQRLPAIKLKTRQLFQYWSLPILVIVVWQGLYELGLIKALTLPPPSMVVDAFWSLASSGELLKHIEISLLRVLEGFVMAGGLAIVLGIGIGIFSSLGRACDLIIQLIKPIPPIAWIPLAILWFGIDEESKIFIIFLGAFFPILINVIDGVRGTDHRLVEVAEILETSSWELVYKVILPSSLPAVMTGLRVGLGIAWMCVVAAELIAASRGMGYLIMDARQLSQTDVVLTGMITIGILGKLMDSLLKLLERRIISWKLDYTGQ